MDRFSLKKKFFKTVNLLVYAIIFGRKTFFFIIKLVFRGKGRFYLFYYNAICKEPLSFRKNQSSIEIDVVVVKNVWFF